ncbi:MAG: alginate export family protein [Acidobacteria bacterium]|nr:alginate export family protein [Acidobacteriota bacterium]
MGDIVVAGSLRTRAEAWNWFEGRADDSYIYPGSIARIGLSQKKARVDWQLEFAVPFLLGLPDDAIAPGSQGQLGLGATYFAANNNRTNVAELFVKQASVRFTGLGGVAGQSLKAGRMEFIDGTEVTPGNGTLAAVKRDRIAHRLLGNFAFSHVGRSFDGAQWVLSRRALNITAFAGRPTRGVFVVDGWSGLDINVLYGAVTEQTGTGANAGEWRVFGLGYFDRRDGVVKTDNRLAAARIADTASIDVGTFGGHYLRTVPTAAGAVDLMAWGAVQIGSWGILDQRAGTFAVEAGWQPDALDVLAPWFRGGYNYGSGDGDPNDSRHGTFFQILPTPRVYARFPFFNMMNTGDAFGEVILRPSRSLNVRSDVHVIRLASRNDLWYAGGGAFQSSTFGFSGRPSSARAGLATLYDVSGDYRVSAYTSVTVYYGRAAGRSVTDAIYASGADADFGYVELTLRF